MALSVRIVVVGDVHDDWDHLQDAKALNSLKPDLVLFTGMYFTLIGTYASKAAVTLVMRI